MSRKIFAIVILVMMLFIMGCEPNDSDNGGSADNGSTEGGNTDNGNADSVNDSDGNNGVEEKNENGEFFFKAKVTSVSDKSHIEVEIIDSEVAFGTYWVLVGDQTEYVGADSVPIRREDIKVGDTIEIIFGGQVMQSYPPRIAATKIIRH